MNKNTVLKTESSIVLGAKPYEKQCGIFFLIDGEKVVYIGKTNNLRPLLDSHKKTKQFDSYNILPCEEEEMDELLLEYIIQIQPKYNLTLPPNDFYKSVQSIKKATGLTAWQIKKLAKRKGAVFIWGMYYDIRVLSGEDA